MATYSTRLFVGQVLVSANRLLAFTVPAGYRVVVRTFHIAGSYDAGGGGLMYLGSSGSELLRAFVPNDGSNHSIVSTRVVYHEGESCYLRSLVVNYVFSLHGYLLQGAGAPLVPTTLPTLG